MTAPATPRYERSPHLVGLIAEVERLAALVRGAPAARRHRVAGHRRDEAVRATLLLDGARPETIPTDEQARATAAAALETPADPDPAVRGVATWLDLLPVSEEPGDGLVAALERLGATAADDSDDLAATLLTDPAAALTELHRRLTRGLVAGERAGQLRALDQAVHDGATGRIVYLPTTPAELPRAYGLLTHWLTATGAREHGVIASGVLHLELLRLHPFDAANGRLARAAARLVLAARDLDPDHLAAPEPTIARDPLGYHEEVGRTLHRRDLTIWLERWAEAVADGLRHAARSLEVLAVEPPERAVAFAGANEAFTIAEYRAEVAAEPAEVRDELSALLDAGIIERVPASRGLRYRRPARDVTMGAAQG